MTEIGQVFVAGAGLMGHGIAQVHAAIGKSVALYEPELARAEAGRDRIAGNLDRAVAKGRLSVEDRDATLARIEPTADLASVADADLVIEAVFEDLGVKTAAVARARRLAPAAAIFASNTSRSPSTDWREAVAAERRSGSSGMHFFSPVPVMPLMELISVVATPGRRPWRRSAGLAARARQAGHRLGGPTGLHRQPRS